MLMFFDNLWDSSMLILVSGVSFFIFFISFQPTFYGIVPGGGYTASLRRRGFALAYLSQVPARFSYTLGCYILLLYYLFHGWWVGFSSVTASSLVVTSAWSWLTMYFLLLLFGVYWLTLGSLPELSVEVRAALFLLFSLLLLLFLSRNVIWFLFIFEVQIVIILILYSNLSTHLTHTSARRSSGWQLNFIYLQFWMAFFSLVGLVYFGLTAFLAFSTADLSVWFFLLNTLACSSYLPILGLFMLVTSLLIKLGLFPFFFWKSDLLRFLPWSGLGLYFGAYTAGILLVSCFMLSCFNFLYLYFKLYLALGLLSGFGLAYLVVTLISISELRVFLIIISICHTIFIVLSILPCVHLEVALFYALAYILLTACSFILLSRISLRGLDFFADLQFAAHWPLFGLSLTLLVLSLSGLPPFLGFWIKFAVILGALYQGYLVVALMVVVFGLLLLFFYFKLYRFIRPLFSLTAPSGLYFYLLTPSGALSGVGISFTCFLFTSFYLDLVSLSGLLSLFLTNFGL